MAVKLSNTLLKLKQINIPQWFKILVSLVLIWILLRNADWQEVWLKLTLVPVWLLVLYIVCNLFAVFLISIRWGVLIPVDVNRQSIRWLSHSSYMGLFYSLFLPSSIGGDVAKWGLSYRSGVKRSRLATTILMDRAIGLISTTIMVIFIIILSYVVLNVEIPNTILQLSLVTSTLVFIGIIIWFGITKIPESIFYKTKLSKIAQFPKLLEISKKSAVLSIIISCVAQLIAAYSLFLLLGRLGVNLSFLQFILIFQIISVVSVIPISFGGFGTSEITFVYLASLFGVDYQACLIYVAISIPLRIVTTSLGGVIGTMLGKT